MQVDAVRLNLIGSSFDDDILVYMHVAMTIPMSFTLRVKGHEFSFRLCRKAR